MECSIELSNFLECVCNSFQFGTSYKHVRNLDLIWFRASSRENKLNGFGTSSNFSIWFSLDLAPNFLMLNEFGNGVRTFSIEHCNFLTSTTINCIWVRFFFKWSWKWRRKNIVVDLQLKNNFPTFMRFNGTFILVIEVIRDFKKIPIKSG